jgi:signal peptidase II
MRRALWGPCSAFGGGVILATFLFDQTVKLWLIYGFRIAERQPFAVTPFLDLVMAWNLGISYGLFPLDSAAGQTGLALFKIAAALFLWVWLARISDWLTASGLGLIAGGALGNALDRLVHGGVADFFSLHLRAVGSSFHWYVFNVADVAIVAGVGVLLYESFAGKRPASDAAASGPKE